MPRSLNQWIDYIQTLHARSIDLSLDRVGRVWERFKPDHLPVVIAVSGTNGKGSSVSMLESIFRHAGYKTAAFTSPHLVVFNERICLNNKPVSDVSLLESFEKIEMIRGDVPLTFFEFNTLLALDIFCQAELDVILLEVGLGGRLDAVNIVQNTLALITSISIDHSAWLGNDREQIAVEKAGIIKPGGRAVIADPYAPDSLPAYARQQAALFVQAGSCFKLTSYHQVGVVFSSVHARLRIFDGFKLKPNLEHIQNNQAGVIATVAMLQDKLPLTATQLASGLQQQSLMGRLQLIKGSPMLLIDVSHNEDSVLAMIQYIDTLKVTGVIYAVFGSLVDKHYQSAFKQLRKRVDHWYLASLVCDRGQSAESVASILFNDNCSEQNDALLFDTPQDAFEQAKTAAEPHDLIVVFGSFHLVGAIIPIINLS